MQVESLIARATTYITRRGILVDFRDLPIEKAGEFDGSSIAVSSHIDAESRLLYLVHSFGSIVAWSEGVSETQGMYDELRDAKCDKENQARLEGAIARFRAFETRASEFSVGMLEDIGAADAIDAFSLFFRADLEAMTIFHREGKAPTWPEFLARWKRDVAEHKRRIEAFTPRPIPAFAPPEFPKQEVLQERD